MTTQLLPNVVQTFVDSNGNALAFGKLYSYAATTTTPQDTYSDYGGTVNANPVVLNAAGQASVWLSSLAYKFVLKDALGNTIWTNDNVSIINPRSIDKTKINGNIANLALAQNVDGSIDVQVDDVTIRINDDNQLEVSLITANNFPSTSKLDIVIKQVSDYSSSAIFQQIPQYEWSGPTLLSNPGTLPPGAAKCCKWSLNGEYLAVSVTGSPFVDVYELVRDVLTRIPLVSSNPAGTTNILSWSPAGDILFVGNTSSPYIIGYVRTGNSFINSVTFTALSAAADCIAMDPRGYFIAVSSVGGTFKMFSLVNGLATDITATTTLTGIAGYIAWSADSFYLASIDTSTHVIDVFQRANNVFTGITAPDVSLYASDIVAFEFSPDGNFFAVAISVSPYVLIFQISSGVFSQLPNPATLPTGAANCIAWSANSQYLVVGHSTSPFVTIYSVSGTTFTKISNPGVLPAAAVVSADFSSTKQYLAVASGTSPYIQVYKTASTLNSNALLWAQKAPNV